MQLIDFKVIFNISVLLRAEIKNKISVQESFMIIFSGKISVRV